MTTPHATTQTTQTAPTAPTTSHARSGLRDRLDITAGAPLLRLALRTDAVVSAANGLGYLAAAPLLTGIIGSSDTTLRGIGAFLVGYAAFVWVVGTQSPIRHLAVRLIIGANLLWTVGSLAVVAAGAGSLTTTGSAWVVLQAATVATFAAFQTVALRRTA